MIYNLYFAIYARCEGEEEDNFAIIAVIYIYIFGISVIRIFKQCLFVFISKLWVIKMVSLNEEFKYTNQKTWFNYGDQIKIHCMTYTQFPMKKEETYYKRIKIK